VLRRIVKISLEVLAALVGVVALAAAILAWRLSEGPVSLEIIRPSIENALSSAVPDYDVRFENPRLVWLREERALFLSLNNAALIDGEGGTAAAAPEVRLTVSSRALMRGLLAPTQIDLVGASALVVRGEDGRVRLGLAETPNDMVSETPETVADTPAPPADDPMSSLMTRLAAAPAPDDPLGYLEGVRIRDAALRYRDSHGGRLSAPKADLTLRRAEDGLLLDMEAQVDLTGRDWPVSLSGRLSGSDARLELNIGEISPARLAEALPVLASVAILDAPIAGRIVLEGSTSILPVQPGEDSLVDARRFVRSVLVDVTIGQGRLDLPKLSPVHERPVTIDAGGLSASYEPATGLVRLDTLAFQAGENKAALTGTAVLVTPPERDYELTGLAVDLTARGVGVNIPGLSQHTTEIDQLSLRATADLLTQVADIERLEAELYGGRLSVAGELSVSGEELSAYLSGGIENYPIDRLLYLWPLETADGARDWIEANMTGGRVVDASFALNAPAHTFALGYAPNPALRLEMNYEGIQANFVPGLPPLTGLAGRALLEGDRFTLFAREGEVAGISLLQGSMVAEPLHKRGAPGRFHAQLDGSVRTVLTLLDMGPFGYPSRYGVDPGRLGGESRLDIKIALPLLRDLSIEQIDFSGRATTRNLSMRNIVEGVDVTEGGVEFVINTDGLVAKGPVKISNIPAVLRWEEDFVGRAATPSVYELDIRLSDENMAGFGFDPKPYLTGTLGIELRAAGRGREISELDLGLDLTDAALTPPVVPWSKVAGDPAKGSLSLKVTDQSYSVENLQVTGPGLMVRGEFAVGADGRLLSADVPRAALGNVADLSLKAERQAAPDGLGEILSLRLRGARFDMRPLLEAFGGEEEAEDQTQAEEDRPSAEEPAGGLGAPYAIDAALETIVLRAGVEVQDTSLSWQSDGTRIFDVAFRGTLVETEEGTRPGEGGVVYADLKDTVPGAERTLIFTASDAGRLVKGLIGEDEVEGGRLRLKATLKDRLDVPLGSRPDMDGRLVIEAFRLRNVPLLARLLTVGSFIGLNDLLQGEGIYFEKLDAPFRVRSDTLRLRDARAYGPSLGLTMDGTFGLGQGETDLKGAIVPAYSLSRVIGSVPIVGDLLTNREGEGVIAVTYRILGRGQNAEILVNPLSALAPGFLRRLFELEGERSADGAIPEGADVPETAPGSPARPPGQE